MHTTFRPSVRLLGYLLFVIWCLAIAELVGLAGYYIRDGRYVPVRARLDTGMGNAIAAAGNRDDKSKGCRWIDTIIPHPYLALALHQDEHCRAPWPNRHGLIGREFPTARESDSFNILLGGGSVAMFLGQYFLNMPLYLEDALNECYLPPKGRSFKVYNGAMGGYRHPQQSIVFLLFGRAFDAFVTLEGWNEYHAALRASDWYGGPTGRFETPEVYYSEMTSNRSDHDVVASIHLANRILSTAKQLWVTERSFLTYFFIEQAVARLERRARQAIEENRDADRTTAESMLALPEDWDRAAVARFNIDQYKWHLVNLHAMAAAQGIRAATFFQPVPSYHKPLTPEEAAVAGNSLDLKPVSYGAMIDDLLRLKQSHGISTISLLEVFKDRRETIYADAVHYEIEGIFPDSKFRNSGVPPTGRSLGYELVSAAMAKSMAEAFNFERKPDCARKS
jgi:hypothetical protein